MPQPETPRPDSPEPDIPQPGDPGPDDPQPEIPVTPSTPEAIDPGDTRNPSPPSGYLNMKSRPGPDQSGPEQLGPDQPGMVSQADIAGGGGPGEEELRRRRRENINPSREREEPQEN